jgi:hypothetical protein
MTSQTATSRCLTRYLAGPALTLGLAIGSAAVANALPPWDIGAYDSCMGNSPYHGGPGELAWAEGCCDRSGGVWKTGDPSGCFAPPAEQSGRNPLPSDAPTHVIQPSPLPGQGGDLGSAPGGVLTSSP